jgi:predicted Ser/Thr protein kinase
MAEYANFVSKGVLDDRGHALCAIPGYTLCAIPLESLNLFQKILFSMREIGRCTPGFLLIDDLARKVGVTREHLQIGLKFWNERRICLYDHSSLLKEYVIAGPAQLLNLLKVLIEPHHVQNALEKCRQLRLGESHMSLQRGQLTWQTVHILWGDLLPQGKHRDELLPVMVRLLEVLGLVVKPQADKFFIPILWPPFNADVKILIPRLAASSGETRKWPIYVLRVVLKREEPQLFFQLLALVHCTRGEMLDDEAIPQAYEKQDWQLFRNCLTDPEHFALFMQQGPPCEIVLRVYSAHDTGGRLQSRRFSKLIWDKVTQIYRDAVAHCTIVLEDYKRDKTCPQDLKFRVDDICKDTFGFVLRPEQSVGCPPVQVKLLWPKRICKTIDSRDFAAAHMVPRIPYHELLEGYGTEIGRGTFGTVSRTRWKGRQVVMKQLETLQDEIKMLLRECLLQWKLRECPTVVKLFGLLERENHIFFVLQYARYQCLKTVFRKRETIRNYTTEDGVNVSFKYRAKWLKDIVEALLFLREKLVLHLDIKPANVMLNDNQTALLGDFGLARELHSDSSILSCHSGHGTGTCVYRAPELQLPNDDGYSFPADMYSFGMLAFALQLSCCEPGSLSHAREKVKRLPNEHREFADLITKVSEIADICTAKMPKQRPEPSYLLKCFDNLLRNPLTFTPA